MHASGCFSLCGKRYVSTYRIVSSAPATYESRPIMRIASQEFLELHKCPTRGVFWRERRKQFSSDLTIFLRISLQLVWKCCGAPA
jgi:hypothetical protein